MLRAADYGVPQNRKRAFIVGIRRGEGHFRFPRPTHGPLTGKAYVPAGAVLDRQRVIGEPNRAVVVYAKTPDLRPSPYAGQLFNGGGRAIDLSMPCPTILATAGGNKTHFIDTLGLVPPYHRHLMQGGKPYTGNLDGARRLTVEECALIQGFPPEVAFQGARSSRYSQVGNAVPPPLAEALGSAIRSALTRGAESIAAE
jgi:DNA (cytosine-5)-methyltransferase 1